MSIKCFLVKETTWCFLWARRYDGSITMQPDGHYHNAMAEVGYRPIIKKEHGDREYNSLPDEHKIPLDSNLWPTKCEKCDYIFKDDDQKQDFYEVMCIKVDSEDEDVTYATPENHREWWPKRNLPPGAMWRAPWYRGWDWDNYTEDPIIVMLPDGTEWVVDSRANNCSMPQDKTHRCWVRTGTPPMITVGKQGYTCAAGAGSIQTGRFHGHLTAGELTSCGDSQIQI